MEHERELEVGNIKYDVHFEITPNGCVIHSAIEPKEDGSHRELSKAEILHLSFILDEKYYLEIESEKAQAPFDNFCEKADNFRESKY